MKSRFLVLVLALMAFGMPCFAGAVHLTGNVSADFLGGNSAQQIINTFTIGDQPLFWGLGWEVILGHVGFGGVQRGTDGGIDLWLRCPREPDQPGAGGRTRCQGQSGGA